MMSDELGQNEFNERELEILHRIAQGQTNQEIADELYLSLNTVRWYNKQIYSKLGIHSRTGAIARAREHGLLDVEPMPPEALTALPDTQYTNLPTSVTPFIGRRQELDEISQLLGNSAVRLLTIIGPGGIGKTRIAQQAARRQLGQYEQGVYLISLAALRVPHENAYEAVLHALTSTLHISVYGDHEAEAQLLNYLRHKHMLLVMDNFEHLLEGAEIVDHILQAAPDVKVLTTSRETLGVYGEVVYQLTGMSTPERETSEDVFSYDSIKLFMQSAARARADFAPAPDELQQITQITQLVEGLPLGIEMAAAWVRSLSLGEILEELRQGLDILESRAHSIRGVFDRSWRLLTPAEQKAFAQMSVFRGGCTREAAQAVTGGNVRMLKSLVDKSLLWHLPDGYYAIHELLRQYAAEKLQAMPGIEALAERHCEYYANFAGHWGRALSKRQQVEALEALEREFENIRAAWVYAAEQGHEEAIKELIDMQFFFDIRGRWQEGNELFDLSAEHLEINLTYGRLLAAQCNFTFRLGMREKTVELANKSMEILSAIDAETLTFIPLLAFGNLALMTGEMDQAERYWKEAIVVAEKGREPVVQAAALGNLGIVEKWRMNFDQAKIYLQQQLAISREIGDHMNAAMALINLGEMAYELGDLEAATTYYRGCLTTAQRISFQFAAAGALGELGRIAGVQQRYDEAQRLLEQSLLLNREHGNRALEIRSLTHLGGLAADQGDFHVARHYYHQALKLLDQHEAIQVGLLAMEGMATYLVKQGDALRAVEILTLIQANPASSQSQQQRAIQRCAQLQTELPPETYALAAQRGSEIDLKTMLEALLAETGRS